MSARTTITGNLTGDPVVRFTASGRPVANFTVVENRRKRDAAGQWVDDAPLFMVVTAWNSLAENIGQSLHKGDRVTVEGRISPVEWEDRETGTKRKSVELVADEVGVSLTFATVPGIVRNAARQAAVA